MPVSFSVKNVPDRVARALRARAARHHRSLQGELLAVLEAAAGSGDAGPPEARTTAMARHAPASPVSGEVRETAVAWGPEPERIWNSDVGRLLPDPALAIPKNAIAEFCRRWKVIEFALFGSVLRDDFRPDSDIDVLVRFDPAAPWSLLDLGDMQAELSRVFRRKVDLVEREAVEQSRHQIRRRHILENHRVIYAA